MYIRYTVATMSTPQLRVLYLMFTLSLYSV